MYRPMVVRFIDDGQLLREIDEDRKYYLVEAEEIVHKLRKRFEKEDRGVEGKAFSFYIDGKEIIRTVVKFHETQSIQSQVIDTIQRFGTWEAEIKQGYINKINEYAEAERQSLIHPDFRAFATRFEEVMHTNFNLVQLRRIFDQLMIHLPTGIYSNLENVIVSLTESYLTVMDSAAGQKEEWFDNPQNFQSFVQYVSANFISISKKRLSSIYVKYKGYQQLQNYLFTIRVESQGFQKMMNTHSEQKSLLERNWNEILFKGFALKTDEMVQSLLIAPTIKTFFENELKKDDLTISERSFITEALHLNSEGGSDNEQRIHIS